MSYVCFTDEKGTHSIDHAATLIDCDRSQAGSSFHAYWNIVCCVCGVGMLGLSQSLSKGGWGALALIILSWLMTLYCSVILIQCLYHPRNKQDPVRLASIPAVAQDAFGPIGGWFAFFFQTWIVLGIPILHFVLAGANMNQLCRGTAAEIGQVQWTIIFCALVSFPYVFFKSMKDTGWTSVFGALAIIITTLICVIVAGIDENSRLGDSPPVIHNSIIWQGYPAALSNISVSFSGNVAFPSIEAAMKKPQHWTRVITTSLTTCVFLYILIAVPGYYVYGASVQNPMYNSLPDGIPRTISIALITISVIMSAPIFLITFTLECEERMNITVERWGRRRELVFRIGFRLLTMIACATIGCVVPFFDLLMALFGAVGCSTTIFIIPVLCYFRLTGFGNKSLYVLAWNFLILVFGTVGLAFGSWFAVEDLVHAFQKSSKS
ncbi:transmembrane amino acid transporter protein-domain-containing protein [Zychaea mexicana]|uniref:transmembrane amino acid transporter protein-domain-containing protein n=1 Tax=Zychaea mexicana TaxID=64656 RepID=UPI0022FDB7B0|nr:transmembrane amino acid transporter protein-domain-containing protein [Zychaea mexicana]KAI9496403.1 transmembrane amino acid transporter protein-domain-containing protein [Zychaea mexicana]